MSVSHAELRDILGRLHSLMALLEFSVGCGDGNTTNNSSGQAHLDARDKTASEVKAILNDGRFQMLDTVMKISTLINGGSADGLSEDEKGRLRGYISRMLQLAPQDRLEYVLSNAIFNNSLTRMMRGRRIQIWYVYNAVLREHGLTPNPDYPAPPGEK
jgi:hypothetical protein